MGSFTGKKISMDLRNLRSVRQLGGDFMDNFIRGNIRFSFTRDLRNDLTRPEHRKIAAATERFNGLFHGDKRILRREVCNWNLLENEKVSDLNYLPDVQTSVHLTMLFDDKDVMTHANLMDGRTLNYFADSDSRFFRFVKGKQFETISVHLGYSALELEKHPADKHSMPKSAPLGRETVMSRAVRGLAALQDNLKGAGYHGQLLFETLDYQTDIIDGVRRSAYEHVTDPGLIRDVRLVTGYGLLLDAAHLLISANNLGYKDPTGYVAEILSGQPENFKYLHVAVPSMTKVRWLDMHRPFHSTISTKEGIGILDIVNYLVKSRGDNVDITINFETPSETVHLDAMAMALALREVLGF